MGTLLFSLPSTVSDFVIPDSVKAALSSEEIEGTVRSWPPKKTKDEKPEEIQPEVTRTNGSDKSDEGSEEVKVQQGLQRFPCSSTYVIQVEYPHRQTENNGKRREPCSFGYGFKTGINSGP